MGYEAKHIGHADIYKIEKKSSFGKIILWGIAGLILLGALLGDGNKDNANPPANTAISEGR